MFLPWLFYILSMLSPIRIDARAICYAGSGGFQTLTNDCSNLDPSYNGTWFCSKVLMCERFLNISPLKRGGRNCVFSRGCAYEEECLNTNTGKPYDGEVVQSRGLMPAGMKIQPYCCQSPVFPPDETGVKYEYICNAATSTRTYSIALILIIACVTAVCAIY